MAVLSPLNRKLLRDIWEVKGQVLAVAAVLVAGISQWTALHSAFRDLVLTRDAYMVQYRMADLFFHVERAPRSLVTRIAAMEGVAQADGRIVFDVTLDLPGRSDPAVGRIVSVPDRPRHHVNGVHVVSGDRPGPPGSNTVLLSSEFAEANAFGNGTVFQALINDKKHSLRVVGRGLSPEYIYVIRGIQDFVPNPRSFGILWTGEAFAEEAFGYGNAVNDIVVRVEEGADAAALLDRISDLLDPYGLTAKYDKKDQLSYRSLNDELKGLSGMSGTVPTIFVTVASVILLLLVSRMVKRQREQIGVLKAFGYSNLQVMGHFAAFSTVIGVLGTVGGLLAGDWLARVMVEMYTEFFRFPVLKHRLYPDVFIEGLVLGLVGPAAAGVWSARRALRILPAVALRHEPPAAWTGGSVLESIEALWRHLPFTWKIIFRNLSRHKGRSAFVVAGVALSTAIVLMSVFFQDSLDYFLKFQYVYTNRSDAKILLNGGRGREALHDARRLPGVLRAEPILEMPYEVRHGLVKKDILVTGIVPDGTLMHILDTERRRVDLPSHGLVLPEVTAKALHARAGDVVIAKPLYPGFEERELRVARVVPQYLGQTAYMDILSASRELGESYAMNGVLLGTDPAHDDALVESVKDTPAVATVELKHRTLQFFKHMFVDYMWIALVFYILFAGVIGFSVIYTGAALSIGERARDLATLRVLGLKHGEVSRVVFGEYFVLSLLGIAFGMPLGLLFSYGIIYAYQSELYTFPFVIYPLTYVKVFAVIIGFLVLARIACERPLRKLDMVSTLKRGD